MVFVNRISERTSFQSTGIPLHWSSRMKHYKVLKLGNMISAVPNISVKIDFLHWIESKHISRAHSHRKLTAVALMFIDEGI
jgi:hypothetical protein